MLRKLVCIVALAMVLPGCLMIGVTKQADPPHIHCSCKCQCPCHTSAENPADFRNTNQQGDNDE